jgi:hypothetical protein
MSVGEWLAATGAVLLAVLLGGLLFALVALVATVRSLRTTVERLQEETLEITRHMQDALLDAEHEVDRVDALLTAAEGVGGRMDGASRLVTKTVTNPVVKVLAIGTGTKQAVRRIRTGDRRSGRERARRAEGEDPRRTYRAAPEPGPERPAPQAHERAR